MKVLGIVGSYHRGGVVDTLVTAALEGAKDGGAETEKIYLIDKYIEFCKNCRKCTQNPGTQAGKCVHEDDMESILAQYSTAGGLIIGAPVNFYNVNAITRRFMERLVGFAYWPWSQPGPKMRVSKPTRKAVVITSSAMPAFLGRIFTGALRALKITAITMGAKPVASIFAGMVAADEKCRVSERMIRKAREAGRKLL